MLMTAQSGVQLYHVKQACQILNMQQRQHQVKHSLVNISTTVCKGNLCIRNTDPDFHFLSLCLLSSSSLLVTVIPFPPCTHHTMLNYAKLANLELAVTSRVLACIYLLMRQPYADKQQLSNQCTELQIPTLISKTSAVEDKSVDIRNSTSSSTYIDRYESPCKQESW